MMRDFVSRILVVMGSVFLLGFGEGIKEQIVIVICILCVCIGCGLSIMED